MALAPENIILRLAFAKGALRGRDSVMDILPSGCLFVRLPIAYRSKAG